MRKGQVLPEKTVTISPIEFTGKTVIISPIELCTAVIGFKVSQFIQVQLDIDPKDIHYHTDNNVVLGYIYNRTKRFYTYVSNRVQLIYKASSPEQ